MLPTDLELLATARALVRPMTLGRPDWDAATVAAAIRTPGGHIYTGVCIHVACGMGFCAEHAAAAEMIKAGETRIEMVVATAEDRILAPCGRCREFLMQIDPRNADAIVLLEGGRKLRLAELLPSF
jgi:cytidine deaminase